MIAALAIGTTAYSAPAYLTGDEGQSRIPVNPDVALHYLYITVHALSASLVLALGPFQFIPRLRNRRPAVHRILGRVYAVSMVVASAAALYAATFSLSGFSAQVAFYLLTAAWLYSLSKGIAAARKRQIALHRIWMIRNYALSFAAVLLRVFLVAGLALRSRYDWLSFEDVYTTSVWASIGVSAVIAEWFIIQRTLESRTASRRRTSVGEAARGAGSGSTVPEVATTAP